jgi:spermidine/putrescine transport system ATP-binding protein
MVQSKVNAIKVQGVSKIYGSGVESVKALDNANLNIFDNEFFTLLGPSGCGKTTLLRLIAGFEDITEGKINLFDQELITLPPNKRPVNTVFQQYSLFPHLNVFENVAFGLRRLKKSNSFINKRTKDVLELVQMQDFISRKTNQLSGGQQQRIALARALAPEPKVLLLDEPLSALDLKLRQAMRVELKTLQKETGITFVFVTHDQEEALTMSDRIAVINEGRIQQIGQPEIIYEKPSNQFVAKFIGEANLISGICLQTGKNGLLQLNSGQKISVDIPLDHIKGDTLTIFIRPERVKINKTNKNSNSKIQEFTYLGNAAHIQIISNDEVINVTLPIDKASSFKKGDKIDLEFPKDFVRIINS